MAFYRGTGKGVNTGKKARVLGDEEKSAWEILENYCRQQANANMGERVTR